MLQKKLNALLANYEVMFHKLQTYHWYVGGATFYVDHEKLELFFEQALQNVDLIAEKILMLGGKPLATMRDMLDQATIGEASDQDVSQEAAFQSVRDDFKVLLADVVDLKKLADDEDNYLISAFADTLIEQLYKDLWMLGQVLA
ncbi:MAG: DNA starvation/stationary phase protection protein [Atopobiaceae bacterium]|nr:DNA starvation/stationary phase protection protein [Atopobiaceae bacterium]